MKSQFMRYLFLVLTALFAISAIASVYNYIGPDGSVVFTDTPPSTTAQPLTRAQINSNSVVTQTANSNPPTTVNETSKKTVVVPSGDMPGDKPYTSFVMVSPVDQQTIQNQPVVPVDVSVTPTLRPGDSVQILLDGSPWGPSAPGTHFTFTAPDRGTHTVAAQLLGRNHGILLATTPVTVYIHQAHLGNFPATQ